MTWTMAFKAYVWEVVRAFGNVVTTICRTGGFAMEHMKIRSLLAHICPLFWGRIMLR